MHGDLGVLLFPAGEFGFQELLLALVDAVGVDLQRVRAQGVAEWLVVPGVNGDEVGAPQGGFFVGEADGRSGLGGPVDGNAPTALSPVARRVARSRCSGRDGRRSAALWCGAAVLWPRHAPGRRPAVGSAVVRGSCPKASGRRRERVAGWLLVVPRLMPPTGPRTARRLIRRCPRRSHLPPTQHHLPFPRADEPRVPGCSGTARLRVSYR